MSHTRKKMSETSFKKSQKVTNYCKRDANFGKKLQTCEKCNKLGKEKLYSYQKMPQTCKKKSKTCKKNILLKNYHILVPKNDELGKKSQTTVRKWKMVKKSPKLVDKSDKK